MANAQKIREMAEALLASESHFLVEVSVSSGRPGQKVLILLDGDEGVSIDECAALSRAIADRIEEEDLFAQAYTLEVSTPGVDYPLSSQRQYRKNIGRTLRVHLDEGGELKGQLKEVHEDHILLETRKGKGKKANTEEVEVPLSRINKSIVQISFK